MTERTPGGNDGDNDGDNGGDSRVERSLRELPVAAASPGFTDGVLARVAAGRRGRRGIVVPALIGAAAAAGALALSLRQHHSAPEVVQMEKSDARATAAARAAGEGQVGRELAAISDELAQLRREQRALAAEIESLRAEDAQVGLPVIYVGQSAGVDVVLDLARFETTFRPGGAAGTEKPGGER